MSGIGLTEGVKMLFETYWYEEIAKVNEDLDEMITAEEIIKFLESDKYAITLGYELRRQVCESFCSEEGSGNYRYTRGEGDTGILLTHPDFAKRDIFNHQTDEYSQAIEQIFSVNGVMLKKSAIKRFLQSELCDRQNLFQISFGLHLDHEKTGILMGKVLGENSYNFRSRNEVIYYFCQANPEYNHYGAMTGLLEEYQSKYAPGIKEAETLFAKVYRQKDEAARKELEDKQKENYTKYSKTQLTEVKDKKQLFEFLKENEINFYGFSRNLMKIFDELCDEAWGYVQKELAEQITTETYTTGYAEKHIHEEEIIKGKIPVKYEEDEDDDEKAANKAKKIREMKNPSKREQLAQMLLWMIPREDDGALVSISGRYNPQERDDLRDLIDTNIAKTAGFDDFLAAMKKSGCDVKQDKQQLKFRIKNGTRFLKCDDLGQDYTVKALQERISGVREVRQKKDKASKEADKPKNVYSGGTRLPRSVSWCLLSRDRIDKLLKGSIEILKKDLLILLFYIYCLENERASLELSARDKVWGFTERARVVLEEAGLFGLYPPNKFDNLILISLCHEEPIGFFGEIFNQSFNKTAANAVNEWKERNLDREYQSLEFYSEIYSYNDDQERELCIITGVNADGGEDALNLWIQNIDEPYDKGFGDLVSRGVNKIKTFYNPEDDKNLTSAVLNFFPEAQLQKKLEDPFSKPKSFRFKSHVRRFMFYIDSHIEILDDEQAIIEIMTMIILDIFHAYIWEPQSE